jgi:hypothetical protein
MEAYETVYGVGLLDDIHNYFPSLLYDTGRFQNVTQILHYVRHQMNSRFNLLNYGASLAARRAASAPGNAVPARTPPQEFVNTLPVNTLRTRRDTSDILSSMQAASMLVGLLNLTGDAQPDTQPADIWTSFRDVVVRPTAQAIARATENISGSTLAENTNCAICQDTIQNTDNATRLLACSHVYHAGCIEQWFQRSVQCPSCRHDIRILGTPVQPTVPVSPIMTTTPH